MRYVLNMTYVDRIGWNIEKIPWIILDIKCCTNHPTYAEQARRRWAMYLICKGGIPHQFMTPGRAVVV